MNDRGNDYFLDDALDWIKARVTDAPEDAIARALIQALDYDGWQVHLEARLDALMQDDAPRGNAMTAPEQGETPRWRQNIALHLMVETDRPTPERAADGRWQEGFDLTQAEARGELAVLETALTAKSQEVEELRTKLKRNWHEVTERVKAEVDAMREAKSRREAEMKAYKALADEVAEFVTYSAAVRDPEWWAAWLARHYALKEGEAHER